MPVWAPVQWHRAHPDPHAMHGTLAPQHDHLRGTAYPPACNLLVLQWPVAHSCAKDLVVVSKIERFMFSGSVFSDDIDQTHRKYMQYFNVLH